MHKHIHTNKTIKSNFCDYKKLSVKHLLNEKNALSYTSLNSFILVFSNNTGHILHESRHWSLLSEEIKFFKVVGLLFIAMYFLNVATWYHYDSKTYKAKFQIKWLTKDCLFKSDTYLSVIKIYLLLLLNWLTGQQPFIFYFDL